jgi:hypothetical protein
MSFNRKPPPRVRSYPTAIPESQRRNAVFARMDVPAAQQIEKEDALRSEPYRRLVALMDCINCGKQNRSQHAHENCGKGKSIKLDDRRAMPLCCDEPGAEGCHTKFDQYRLIPGGHDAHVEQGLIWAAQTRAEIEASGQWPKNLPRWTE